MKNLNIICLCTILFIFSFNNSYGQEWAKKSTNWIYGVGIQSNASEFFIYNKALLNSDVICIDGIEYNFIRTIYHHEKSDIDGGVQYIYRLANYKKQKFWSGFIGKCNSKKIYVNKRFVPDWWSKLNPETNNAENIPMSDFDENGKPEVFRFTPIEEEAGNWGEVFEFNGKVFESISAKCAGGCISSQDFTRIPKPSNWITSLSLSDKNKYFSYTPIRHRNYGGNRAEILDNGAICINGNTFGYKKIDRMAKRYGNMESVYEVLNFKGENNWAGYISTCNTNSKGSQIKAKFITLEKDQIKKNPRYQLIKQKLIAYVALIAKLDKEKRVATEEFREELSKQYLSKELHIKTIVLRKISTFEKNSYMQECTEYQIKMPMGWRTFAYANDWVLTVDKYEFYYKFSNQEQYVKSISKKTPCTWHHLTDFDRNKLPEIISFSNRYFRNKKKYEANIKEFDGAWLKSIYNGCSGVCF